MLSKPEADVVLPMDYRVSLQAEFERRKRIYPHYSMRRFADTLGLSPAFVSKLMNGKKDLSIETAVVIAERLGFNKIETQNFCRLIQIYKLKSAQSRDLFLYSDLENKNLNSESQELSLEAFQVISDWYHYAILELAAAGGIPVAKSDLYVSTKLGINKKLAQTAIERLAGLHLIEKGSSYWRKSVTQVRTPTNVTHRALRNFHSQMIQKALVAIEEQEVAERDVSGLTIAISKDKIAVAKKEIQAFRQRLAKLLKSSQATVVYQLNIQFFSLTPVRKTKRTVK